MTNWCAENHPAKLYCPIVNIFRQCSSTGGTIWVATYVSSSVWTICALCKGSAFLEGFWEGCCSRADKGRSLFLMLPLLRCVPTPDYNCLRACSVSSHCKHVQVESTHAWSVKLAEAARSEDANDVHAFFNFTLPALQCRGWSDQCLFCVNRFTTFQVHALNDATQARDCCLCKACAPLRSLADRLEGRFLRVSLTLMCQPEWAFALLCTHSASVRTRHRCCVIAHA